jgi:hypothetical protein
MMGPLNTSRIDPDVKEKMEKEIKNFIEHRTRPVPGFVPNTRAVTKDPSDEKTMDARNQNTKHKFVFDKDVTGIMRI